LLIYDLAATRHTGSPGVPRPDRRIDVARTGAQGVAHVRAAPPDVVGTDPQQRTDLNQISVEEKR